MIPYQAFNCPRCGAPGHVQYGQAEYSCVCRLGAFESPSSTWPKCLNCGQPIYVNHVCGGGVAAHQSNERTP